MLFLVDLGLLKGYDASNSMITTMVRTNVSEFRILCLFYHSYLVLIISPLVSCYRLSNFGDFIRGFWAKISWRAQFVDTNKQLSISGKQHQTPNIRATRHV